MLDKFIKMRALIEKGWTRGAPARDKWGHSVLPKSDRAVCWCLFGAMSACDGFVDAENLILSKINHNITGWNDTRNSVKPILNVLDTIIEELKC